ncbi:MAG: hypothetical protein JRE24_04970 [Deltaproteobacteria bacterium]|nr:hypothetical protein [Deltaproteobacteria bacterium]
MAGISDKSTLDFCGQSADQNPVVLDWAGFKWLKSKKKGGSKIEKAKPTLTLPCSLIIECGFGS